MTTPEQFYNDFVDEFNIKHDIKTMCFCLEMLRRYGKLLIHEKENEIIKEIYGEKLLKLLYPFSNVHRTNSRKMP